MRAASSTGSRSWSSTEPRCAPAAGACFRSRSSRRSTPSATADRLLWAVMGSTAAGVLGSIDAGALGSMMLEAARAARIGVTISVVEDFRYLYVSEAAAEIMGWPAEELLVSHPFAHVSPKDIPRLQERLARRTRGE